MVRLICLPIAVLILAANFPLVLAQPNSDKKPLPSEAEQQDAMVLVREVYQSEFATAKTGEAKVALAQKMLKEAPTDNEAQFFVVSRVARDIASGAGSIEVAAAAIDQIAGRFQIDALEMKLNAAVRAALKVTDRADRKAFAEFALPLVKAGLAADQFKLASTLARKAEPHARGARELALAKSLALQAEKAESLAARFKNVEVALATLNQQPNDAEANQIVGHYKCLAKGDWDGGLSYLALSSDATLKKLAVTDLGGADDSKGKAAIGDGWWDHAQQQTGATKDNLLRRAAFWYRQALEGTEGLVKAKLEKRVAAAPAPLSSDGGVGGLPANVVFKMVKTARVGGGGGNGFIEDRAPEGGYLIGFRAIIGGTNVAVLRPIYTKDGKRQILGKTFGMPVDPRTGRPVNGVAQQVVAKPGYAVGALNMNTGASVDSFRIVFMKVTPTGLDASDSYISEQLGGVGGGPRTLSGAGNRVVGVYGYADRYLYGMGLIVAVPTKDGWMTIFHGSDASKWNTDYVKGKEMARSLKDLPDDIRFLRMSMLGKRRKHVIIPMTKDNLDEDRNDGRIGWNGQGREGWGGYHLGIYNSASRDRILDGLVYINSRHRGWGFGHIHAARTPVQAYSWAGQAVPKAVFEVAIKFDDLTDAESKLLLR
jgi:hypothetical protein